MKILFISRSKINSGFGTETTIYRNSMKLCEKNDITIFTTNLGRDNVDYKSDLQRSGVEIYEIQIIKRKPFYSPKGIMKLVKAIWKCDLLYVWEPPPFLNPLISVTARLLSKKSIRGRHNPFFYNTDIEGNVPKLRYLIRTYEKLNLFFDLLYNYQHVENSDHLEFLTSLGFRNPFMIPACVNTSAYTRLEKYPEFTLLFLGRLNFHKGADRIPTILKKIHESIPKLDVIIVGNGIFREKIEKSLDRSDWVSFKGFVKDDEKKEILARSHILVSPTRLEAFMLTGIEALSSGTPVVSFNVPGPTDYIVNDENGYICSSIEKCTEDIAKIHSAWVHSGYEKFSQKAHESALAYDCKQVDKIFEEKLFEIYRS